MHNLHCYYQGNALIDTGPQAMACQMCAALND
jgi:hypothetical protein